MATGVISERASVLLKTLVEHHIRDGQPVGSSTLMRSSGLAVSAATIRNVMSDLEERGYLHSPHTSAGRVPTALGYRLFVDTLLQVQPLDDQAVSALRAELHHVRRELQVTMVYVTHDREDAAALADTVVELRAGRVVSITPGEAGWIDHPA